MRKSKSEQKERNRKLESYLVVFLIFVSFFLLQSCADISKSQNEFKVRDVKIKLSEYFTIKQTWNDWWIELPTELELPQKVKVEGLTTVKCMEKYYKIECSDPRCKPYQIKWDYIDEGKFDMNSRWYQICKAAASSGKK